jgi:proline iminopeptidase
MIRLLFVAAISLALLAPQVTAHQDPEIAGYIEADGGRIWYRLNGAAHLHKKPAIIVMHGGPGGTHRGNMPYVALSDDYPVILYDQLGTGNSDRPGDKANWTVERFVAEIDHIRKALGLREVIIAGHSWGGTLAAEYAVRRPVGLRAVILSSPLINTRQWIADNQRWIDQLPADVAETIRTHEAAGTTDTPEYRRAEAEFYKRHMCRKSPCPGARYRVDGPPRNMTMYEHMWGPSEFFAPGTLQDYDISARLHTINVPSLMICGEFDEAAPESCRKYAGMIANATTFIVPDAGHATMAEDEALYMKTVRSFLQGAIK